MKCLTFAWASTLSLFIGLALVQNGFALTISPVRVEVSADPGQAITGEIQLFNEEPESRTFYSSTANFEARGEGGAPHFLPEREGLATWISVQEKVVLEPGERINVPYVIQVPAGVDPGGYFAAIFWGTSPPYAEGGGQVAIGGKLGMLILLNVTGDAVEGGGILEFGVQNGAILNSLPITFTYRFANDGATRIRPVGEIEIKNTFGLTSAVLDANIVEGNVLPGSIREFNVLWHTAGQRIDDLTKAEELELISAPAEKPKGFFNIAGSQWQNFAFGMYSASLRVAFGEQGAGEQVTHRFFVLPWQLLSIIFVILVVAGFLGFIGIKRYNRWIIGKHTLKS